MIELLPVLAGFHIEATVRACKNATYVKWLFYSNAFTEVWGLRSNLGSGTIERQRILSNYAKPNLNGSQCSIVRPPVKAKNFEFKPTFVQKAQ